MHSFFRRASVTSRHWLAMLSHTWHLPFCHLRTICALILAFSPSSLLNVVPDVVAVALTNVPAPSLFLLFHRSSSAFCFRLHCPPPTRHALLHSSCCSLPARSLTLADFPTFCRLLLPCFGHASAMARVCFSGVSYISYLASWFTPYFLLPAFFFSPLYFCCFCFSPVAPGDLSSTTLFRRPHLPSPSVFRTGVVASPLTPPPALLLNTISLRHGPARSVN